MRNAIIMVLCSVLMGCTPATTLRPEKPVASSLDFTDPHQRPMVVVRPSANQPREIETITLSPPTIHTWKLPEEGLAMRPVGFYPEDNLMLWRGCRRLQAHRLTDGEMILAVNEEDCELKEGMWTLLSVLRARGSRRIIAVETLTSSERSGTRFHILDVLGTGHIVHRKLVTISGLPPHRSPYFNGPSLLNPRQMVLPTVEDAAGVDRVLLVDIETGGWTVAFTARRPQRLIMANADDASGILAVMTGEGSPDEQHTIFSHLLVPSKAWRSNPLSGMIVPLRIASEHSRPMGSVVMVSDEQLHTFNLTTGQQAPLPVMDVQDMLWSGNQLVLTTTEETPRVIGYHVDTGKVGFSCSLVHAPLSDEPGGRLHPAWISPDERLVHLVMTRGAVEPKFLGGFLIDVSSGKPVFHTQTPFDLAGGVFLGAWDKPAAASTPVSQRTLLVVNKNGQLQDYGPPFWRQDENTELLSGSWTILW